MIGEPIKLTGKLIRACALQPGRLGETVSVLTGHRAVVSFVEFCPVIPHALLSCSFDGTCRIWDATSAAVEPIVLHATQEFATGRAGGDPEAGPSLSTRRAQAAPQPQAGAPEVIVIDGEDSHVAGIPVRWASLGHFGV